MEITKIGTVAAQNIVRALGLDELHVGAIETAIDDEINAMSSHFTLALADIQTSNELAVNKLTSTFSYVEENIVKVAAVSFALFVAGAVVGLLL